MPDVRGHNEGSIFQRTDGRKVAAVSLGDGRRATRYCPHRHPPEDRDRPCPESRRLLKALQAHKDAGTVDGSRLTVATYLSTWLGSLRVAPATYRKHEMHVRVHLAPALGHHRLTALSKAHVERYLETTDLHPQTLRHHRATLRLALAAAMGEYVNVNVAALARPPKLDTEERTVLTADQARTLIDGTRAIRLPDGYSGPVMDGDRYHALWTLLVTTGCREAEALGLTWDRIDLERASYRIDRTLQRIDGVWRMMPTKTPKSRRTVFLPPVTVEALREHRRRQLERWIAAGRPGDGQMVFTDTRGRPVHGSKLTELLYPILDQLGLPRVTVHDLRHSAATILYGAGVPLEAIADMLGHSTTRVTADLYRHRVEDIQRGAADAMERAIAL